MLDDELTNLIQERAKDAPSRLRRALEAGLVAAGLTAVLSGLLSRVRSLWRNSVEEVFTLGQTYNRNEPWLQWQLGRTEKHCRDCLALNGQIHRASEWRAAGIQPQSPDLECGGWNCDCRLVELPGYTGEGQGSIG